MFSYFKPQTLLLPVARNRSQSTLPGWLTAMTGLASQKVRQIGDPVLRQKASIVQPEYMFGAEFNKLVDTMLKSMRDKKGVGIAAPQIGASLRVIAVEFNGKHLDANLKKFGVEGVRRMQMQLFPLHVVVNPEMKIIDPTAVAFKEGCLSMQGFSAVVPRMKQVEISGVNPKGERVNVLASGWIARIFQHEMDHLDGHLFIDSMQYKTLINESWKGYVS
eukprot:gene18952-20858_t